MKKALITAEVDETTVQQLGQLGYKVDLAGWGQTRKALSSQELISRVVDIQLLVVELEKVTAEIIHAAPELETIQVCRSGPGIVDVDAATERGVKVLIAPARNADSVAEFAVGMLLGIVRELAAADRHLRIDGWYVGDDIPYFHFRGPELKGKTLGLIGCGAIGRAFLDRMRGFSMQVLIFDPYIRDEDVAKFGKLAALDTVLQEADFIIILCPLSRETEGMIGANEIAWMKPSSYLINPARAAVVDEKALHTALVGKNIAGAALDVFWEEPLPTDSPWLELDNVLLTPHIAGASNNVRVHQGRMLIEDLKALLAGECPDRLVNPEILG